MYGPKSETIGSFTPDNLQAGLFPVITETVTIKNGENLKRGSLLGRISESGKYVLSHTTDSDGTTAIEDGSEEPRGILAGDVDASSGDKTGVMYKTGQFNSGSVTIGRGHTVSSVQDVLDFRSIYLEKAQS